MLKCPHCGTMAKTERGMIKHLTGTAAYGGHGLSMPEAHATVNRILYPKDPVPSTDTPKAEEEKTTPTFSPSGDFLRDLMASLACNKALPKYQFERRIDAILALFLPEIFSNIYGWNVTTVVPEFPIKSLDNNQTTNVDYIFFREANPSSDIHPAWIFFELKTDSASLSQGQLTTYLDAKKRGMKALRTELNEVLHATRHREKYMELLQRIDQYPIDLPIEIVYLIPDNFTLSSSEEIHLITFQELGEIELSSYFDAWKLFQKEILPVFSKKVVS